MIPFDRRPLWVLRFRVACAACHGWHRALRWSLQLGVLYRVCGLEGCDRAAAEAFPEAGKVFRANYRCGHHFVDGAEQLLAGLAELGQADWTVASEHASTVDGRY